MSDELQALCDRLKLEAQIHAQEARTANATIAEIYQVVTGATGEPGNWHGAEPVRALAASHARLLDALKNITEEVAANAYSPAFEHMGPLVIDARAAIAAAEGLTS